MSKKRKGTRWRADFPYKRRAAASTVSRALDAVKVDYGELTPANTVEAARDPDSPLHAFFEWDGRKAAQEYRLEQARGLIRAVIYTPAEGDGLDTRIYVHVLDQDEGRTRPKYEFLEDALQNPAYRAQILAQAKREARAFREKYAVLKELAKIFVAIDQLSG